MTGQMTAVAGTMLPETYEGWMLQTHEIGFTSSGEIVDGIIEYKISSEGDSALSLYIEMENDGSWGGALIDDTIENVHKDCIETFYADSLAAVLTEAKAIMESRAREIQ